MGFKNLELRVLSGELGVKSFIPKARAADAPESTYLTSPLLQSSSQDVVHYGHSILFEGTLNPCIIKIHMYIDVQYFTFDAQDNLARSMNES